MYSSWFNFLLFPEISVLEDNKELENILSDFQKPTMKYGTFKVAGFGETILLITFVIIIFKGIMCRTSMKTKINPHTPWLSSAQKKNEIQQN